MEIQRPYLMFLGDAPDQLAAKTAKGVAYWRPDWCHGQLRMDGCKADLGLADMTLEEAAGQGVKTLIIGIANAGGRIGESWEAAMLNALDAGMDIASGLHEKVADVPSVRDKAADLGRSLFDVRHSTGDLEVGTGAPRTGRRVLTVGTDCSSGKMFTSLALEQELAKRGESADFRATGQTGILIAGSGVSVDAVISDFVSGAVESISPENDPRHWDLIEGQGSLFHPSFAAVSMGLLHGAQAEYLVMCHEPGRSSIRGLPHYKLPEICEAISLNEQCARLTNPKARVIGISCNTSSLSEADVEAVLTGLSDQYGMPAVDPVRNGVGPIVDAMLADAGETL